MGILGYIVIIATIGGVFAPFGYRRFGFTKPKPSSDTPNRELGETLHSIRETGRP